MSIRININDEVRVRLTDKGRDVLKFNHYRLVPHLPFVPSEEDAGGWSTWQLWRLMQEFGDSMHNGCDVPFETEIEIVR